MDKIWIVKASAGQYDDYQSWDVVAFLTKQAAQDYVDEALAKIDYDAAEELRELQAKYCSVFYETQDVDSFTDEQWNQYYDQEEAWNNKALVEVQAKYPNIDLTFDENFNGYYVHGPVGFVG